MIWDAAKRQPWLRVPEVPVWAEHAAYKCYVYVELSELPDGWNRDRIMAEINARGVPCYSGSCSEIYLEKAFDNTGLKPKDRLPIAKELGETSLMFLVHPTLGLKDVENTCEVIQSVLKRSYQ